MAVAMKGNYQQEEEQGSEKVQHRQSLVMLLGDSLKLPCPFNNSSKESSSSSSISPLPPQEVWIAHSSPRPEQAVNTPRTPPHSPCTGRRVPLPTFTPTHRQAGYSSTLRLLALKDPQAHYRNYRRYFRTWEISSSRKAGRLLRRS
jgi:hypothetical protein